MGCGHKQAKAAITAIVVNEKILSSTVCQEELVHAREEFWYERHVNAIL